MKVHVKLFSFFQQYASVDEVTVEISDGATVNDLLAVLGKKFNQSAFTDQKTLLMINKVNALPQTVLREGDTVHLLPILGGG